MDFSEGYFRAALVAMLALDSADLACRSPKQSDALASPAPNVALRGIADRRNVRVTLETDRGVMHCTVDAAKTPNGAALFVGLATGRAAHREPRTSAIVQRPLYRQRKFVRSIPDVYVQTGCPLDTGMGNPGYRIPPEPRDDDAARLSEAGALVLLPYTPPPNREDPSPPPPGHTIGSQFAVTMTNMKHLAGTVTVLGHCNELDVARAIARAREQGETPMLLRATVDEVAPEHE